MTDQNALHADPRLNTAPSPLYDTVVDRAAIGAGFFHAPAPEFLMGSGESRASAGVTGGGQQLVHVRRAGGDQQVDFARKAGGDQQVDFARRAGGDQQVDFARRAGGDQQVDFARKAGGDQQVDFARKAGGDQQVDFARKAGGDQQVVHVRKAGGDQQVDFKALADATLGATTLAAEFAREARGYLALSEDAKSPVGAASAMDWRDGHDLRGIVAVSDPRG